MALELKIPVTQSVGCSLSFQTDTYTHTHACTYKWRRHFFVFFHIIQIPWSPPLIPSSTWKTAQTSHINFMVEILSLIKLMFVEHLLYAFPDFSSKPYFQSPFVSSLPIPPHSKEEGDREGRAQFSVTSEKTPWCAFATCGRSVMSSVCKNHSMVQQDQTDICVRDGQTKMEHPIVALPEEAGLEGFSGWVSFPGFCRWKQGLKVVTPLCRQGHRGPEWIPSDSFLPGIRPADSFFLVSASDNFLILKEFPNSGTLCRHLKTGLMEAIQLYIYWICNLHHSGHCGPEQQAWQDLLEGGRWWMSISSAQEGWCALPEWTCSISVALPWELQNIPLNQCSGVAD